MGLRAFFCQRRGEGLRTDRFFKALQHRAGCGKLIMGLLEALTASQQRF